MSAIVLCNLGARDVQQTGANGLLEELRPAREQGKKILEDYPARAGSLALPIIEPALRYILDCETRNSPPEGKQPVTRVVLFGTDNVEEKYRSTDTLHFAEIAVRKTKEIFGGAFEPKCVTVKEINPAFYDEAYDEFGRLLQDLRVGRDARVYVVLAGGIPACNTALLLQGVRLFGERLTAVYPPPNRDPRPLGAGRQIMEAFSEAAVTRRLEELDFANALPYLEALGAGRALTGLVRYAAQRLAFDFQSAFMTLESACADASSDRKLRNFIDGMRHRLDVLLQPENSPERFKALLEELYWNARITYDHRQYADFLGRVYRFQEAVLRYLVESVYRLDTDLSPAVREKNQEAWEKRIRENSVLLNYFQNLKVDGKTVDWHTIGRKTYKALLSYATGEGGLDSNGLPLLENGARDRCRDMAAGVYALDRLVELRHRTIIGHDFRGVSESLLLEYSPGGKPPTKALAEIMDMLLDRKLQDSDYERIAKFAVEELKKRNR